MAATNSRWWPDPPVQVTSRPARARSISEPVLVGQTVEQRGVLAAQLARTPRAPARTATVPRPLRRPLDQCASRGRGPGSRPSRAPPTCRRPACPLSTRQPPRPASASSSRRRSWSPTARRPKSRRLCTGRVAGAVLQPGLERRRGARAASGLGAVPSSRRSACSSRSNWRSAAAYVALRRRWRGSAPGGPARRSAPRASSSSHRSASRSSSRRSSRSVVARALAPRLVEVVGQQRARRTRRAGWRREPHHGRPARSARHDANSSTSTTHVAVGQTARPSRCAAAAAPGAPPSARRA